MAYYQRAAEEVMRELGITMVSGMLTELERKERGSIELADSLLDVDIDNPTFRARMRMLLATRVSQAPLSVLLGKEERQQFKQQQKDYKTSVRSGSPDTSSPAVNNGHMLTRGFDAFARDARDQILGSVKGEWEGLVNRYKDVLRDITKRLNKRNKNHPDVVRGVNDFSAQAISAVEDKLNDVGVAVFDKSFSALVSRLTRHQKNHDTDLVLAYRERTQWVKAQYAQDLRRIRDVQEKLFRRARELKSQVERQELAASQQLHTGGDDAFCATRDDHVKRMAKDSSGMVKELAGNVAQLQAELDEMRQKMQRERTARIASETAKREFQDRLAEKEGLLDELRDKFKGAAEHLAQREAELAAAAAKMAEMEAKLNKAMAEVMTKTSVINALKSKNRKLDAQRLTEKKALKARMSAMANRARANTDASEGAAATPDEEDTPGEVDDGAAAAALAKKSARALAAETARRAKQAPRPGRRTLQSTDFNYDGPLAQVAEVDCQCTCGAALEEGAAGDGDAVQHAEDCALFNGLLAPDVAPTPLRTSQSTMRLRSTADGSDDEDVVIVTDDAMLGLQHPLHRARSSRGHPRIAGQGMVLRSVDSPARGVSFRGMNGVQQGQMYGMPSSGIQFDAVHQPMARPGEEEEPEVHRAFPLREPSIAADGYRWTPGGSGSNSYRSWVLRHRGKHMHVGGAGMPVVAARVAKPHPLLHQGNPTVHHQPESTQRLIASASHLELATAAPAHVPRAGSAAGARTVTSGLPTDLSGGASVVGFAPSGHALATSRSLSALSTARSQHHLHQQHHKMAGVQGSRLSVTAPGGEQTTQDVDRAFGNDEESNTVAALAKAYEDREASHGEQPHTARALSTSRSSVIGPAAVGVVGSSPGAAATPPLLITPKGSFYDLRTPVAHTMRTARSGGTTSRGHDPSSHPTPMSAVQQPQQQQQQPQQQPFTPHRSGHGRSLSAADSSLSMPRSSRGGLDSARSLRRAASRRPASAAAHTRSRSRGRLVAARSAGGRGGEEVVAAGRRGDAMVPAPVQTPVRVPVSGRRPRSSSTATTPATGTTGLARAASGTGHSFTARPASASASSARRSGSVARRPSMGGRRATKQSMQPDDEGSAYTRHLVNWSRHTKEPDGKSHVVHTAFSPNTFAPARAMQRPPRDDDDDEEAALARGGSNGGERQRRGSRSPGLVGTAAPQAAPHRRSSLRVGPLQLQGPTPEVLPRFPAGVTAPQSQPPPHGARSGSGTGQSTGGRHPATADATPKQPSGKLRRLQSRQQATQEAARTSDAPQAAHGGSTSAKPPTSSTASKLKLSGVSSEAGAASSGVFRGSTLVNNGNVTSRSMLQPW